MLVEKELYDNMPDNLKSLFVLIPDEVEAEFDKAGASKSPSKPVKQGVNHNTHTFRLWEYRESYGNGYDDNGTPSRFFQQCPPDPSPNPCLDCQECITDDEPEATKGRWPANVIHSGEDEVLTEFDKAGVRQAGGRVRNNRKKTNGYNGGWGDMSFNGHTDSGSASRFFQQCPPDPTQHPEAARFHYCPKAPKSERSTPGNNHPTQKPLSLIKYLCRLTKTPTGGIVLDPFGGSGTTALAALSEGRDYIIIEKEPEYAEVIRRRIAEYTGEEIMPKEIKIKSGETASQMSLW